MKYTICLALVAVLSIGFASCSNETTTNDTKTLPTEVKNDLTKNFKSNVSVVTVENNTVGADEYKVILADGTKVEYKGTQWDEVEVPAGQSVPANYIAAPIQKYLATNYPDVKVVKIERESKGFEVKLSNGVEIDFDTNGNFVKIDK